MGIWARVGFGLTERAWGMFSLPFYLMVVVSLAFYYGFSKRLQWRVLLVTSMVFYVFAGTPYTIAYLLISTATTWKAACLIEDNKDNPRKAKRLYTAALLIDVAFLAILKYTNFFLGNMGIVVSFISGTDANWSVSWVASLGISFYTLQIVSYLTDCYWGIVKPQRSFAKVLLFSSFFPQMISGPISRYDQLGSQLYIQHIFKRENIMNGLMRISLGFFKKLVIAENFSRLAKYFLNSEQPYSTGIFTFVGIGCYVIELYGDFAGCMDIVLGVAKSFGITMVENFQKPFSSTSIQEFWTRWHITLGAWLKDYIMYPLLRTKRLRKLGKILAKKTTKAASQKIVTYLAMLVLWFCMGLWHGGGWNYITEGLWFWTVLVLGQLAEPHIEKVLHTKNKTGKLIALFRNARTACIYAVGAIFFLGPGTKDAIGILGGGLSPKLIWASLLELPVFPHVFKSYYLPNEGRVIDYAFNGAVGFVIFMFLSLWEGKHGRLNEKMECRTLFAQITAIILIFYFVAILGVYGPGYNPSDFIYGGF